MSDGRFGVGGQGGYLGPGYGPLYLDMLVDVKIGTPTNQYVLTYNSATKVQGLIPRPLYLRMVFK
jgi:hypothetical protein